MPNYDVAAVGLDGLNSDLAEINAGVAGVPTYIQSNMVSSVTSFLSTAAATLAATIKLLQDTKELGPAGAQLVELCANLMLCGQNALYTYIAGNDEIEYGAQNFVSSLAGTFTDAYAILNNTFVVPPLFPDFSGVYGSSGGSATDGGSPLSPLAGQNTFSSIVPPVLPLVAVTPLAQQNIGALLVADPIFDPMELDILSDSLSGVGGGVTFPGGASPAASAAGGVDPSRPLSGFRFVKIMQGDTLQRIAARELGDTSQWASLVSINSLAYPYISSTTTTSAGVANYGDTIKVPAATIKVSVNVDPITILGTDIYLDGSGFLTSDGSDYGTVSGPANYVQAIENALDTSPGELIFHLTYGCSVRRLLGKGSGPTIGALAAGYVGSTIKADKRTVSVPSCVAAVVGDSITVIAKAITVEGSPVPVNTAIQ